MRPGAAAALALAALRPGAALACPACFSASTDGVLVAYLVSAVVMTLLPLALVGGLVLWVRRRGEPSASQSSQA